MADYKSIFDDDVKAPEAKPEAKSGYTSIFNDEPTKKEAEGPSWGSMATQAAYGPIKSAFETAAMIPEVISGRSTSRSIDAGLAAHEWKTQHPEAGFGDYVGQYFSEVGKRPSIGSMATSALEEHVPSLEAKNAPERIMQATTGALPFGLLGGAKGLAGNLLTSGVAGGAGAGAGEVAKEAGLPQHYQIAANVIGGLFGGGATATVLGAGAKATQAANNTLGLMTKKGQELKAGQILDQKAADSAAFRAALEKESETVPGSQPTTFQQTGDMGIGSLERAHSTKNPQEFMQRRAEQNTARLEQLKAVQESGNPEEIGNYLRQGLQEIDNDTNQALNATATRAWEQAHRLGGHNDPETYGAILRHDLQTAEANARTRERALWNAVDPNHSLTIMTQPLGQAVDTVYGRLSQAATASLTPAEQRIRGVIQRYQPAEPFGELTDLRSLVSSEMRSELYGKGRTQAYARLSQLRGEIENVVNGPILDSAAGSFGQSQASQRLQAATEATRQRAQTFNADPYKGILRREGAYGPFKMKDSAVAQKIFHPGPTGFQDVQSYRAAVGPQVAEPMLEEYAVSSLRRAAMNEDGTINPAKFDTWRRAHTDSLRAMPPTFHARIDSAADSSRLMADVASRRAEVLNDYRKSAFGKLIDQTEPEDITRMVGGMFGKQNSTQVMDQLSRAVSTNPAAKDGLRRAVADYITKKFVSNTEAGTSENNLIRSDQFQTFMKNNKDALGKVFNEDEVKSMQAIADDLHRSNRSIAAIKLPGGSNTAQDVAAMAQHGLGTSLLAKLIVHGTGIGAGGVLGNIPGAIAGYLGAHAAVHMRDAGINNVDRLVREALLNPNVARDLLKRVGPEQKGVASQRFLNRLKVLGMYGATGGQ
jgi:hypothetical protein